LTLSITKIYSQFTGPNQSNASIHKTQMLCQMQQIKNLAYPFNIFMVDMFILSNFDK
jgi:hypothetical protein